MRHQLTGIIECTDNNYCAYVKEVDGVAATGATITEIKEKLKDLGLCLGYKFDPDLLETKK